MIYEFGTVYLQIVRDLVGDTPNERRHHTIFYYVLFFAIAIALFSILKPEFEKHLLRILDIFFVFVLAISGEVYLSGIAMVRSCQLARN